MAISDPDDVLGIEGLESPEVIGVGGFATVYKAFQPAFRRTVAVKVLAMSSLDDPARERFERECQAMGSISEHPSIVTVHDAGFTSTGRPYLVMAHMPGGSLQDLLDDSGPQQWQDATLAGIGLAGALETAHRADIIHRDIKPANVLVSQFGEPELTDFGIARISGGHETRSGVITASMSHAPPEILDGKRPTVGADIYSLASTIFELMSGAPAFSSDTDESMVPMLRRILTDPPPDLRSRGVPDGICGVIERAMAKEPDDRYGSAEEFGRALQAARRAEGLDPGRMVVARAPGEVVPAEEAGAAPSGGVVLGKGPASGSPSITTPTVAAPTMATPVVGDASAALGPPGSVPGAAVPPAGPVVPPVGPDATGRGGKRGLLIGIGVVLVLVVIGAAVILGGRGSNPKTDPSTTAPAVTDYNDEIAQNFVEACRESAKEKLGSVGDARNVCECTFDLIQTNISFKDFKALEEKTLPKKADAELRDEIAGYSAQCVKQETGG